MIDLSGAWRLKQAQHRAVYGFKDADSPAAAEFTEKAVYGLPELNGERIAGAAVVANPGCYATSVILASGAAGQSGRGGPTAGNHFGFEVGRLGRGQGTDSAHPFCFSGRQSFRVFGVWSSACGRDSGAVEAGCGRADFHPAPAAHPARNSLHDLCASESRAETGGSGVLLPRVLCRQRWVRIFANAAACRRFSFRCTRITATSAFCLAKDGRRLVLVSCLDNLLKGRRRASGAEHEPDVRVE